MKLYLKNIGKISEASVEIKGITVIAGENNTGKSTVGKALFLIFNSFYEVHEQIRQERITSVMGVLHSIYRRYPSYGQMKAGDTREFAEDIVNKAKDYIKNPEMLEEELNEIIGSQPEQIKMSIEKADIEDIINRIIEIINISDMDILRSVIYNNIDSEFNSQILNIYSKSSGQIGLEIRDKELVVNILEDTISIDDMSCNLHTEAIYIDDPFVLDDLDYKNFINGYNFRYQNHRIHLENKILDGEKNSSIVGEIIVENKLNNIFEKLLPICEGDVIRLKNRNMGYQLKNSDKILSVKNLSTGLKTFAILKTLLSNGTIKNNGTVILDEPEIHLHPEWQLLFAEIIVLLHKEFGMHILLNTHSPYFLRAIEVYSAKYEVSDMCKYYLSEVKENGEAYINDVTNEINKIYEKLSSPLQQLEDERWNY